jgi:hypothetical protein
MVALPLTLLAEPYEISPDSIMKHIYVLAADSLEGRRVGEDGEMKAATYIISEFKEMGLEPAGDNSDWLQPFEFTKLIQRGPDNVLAVNGQDLALNDEFVPLPQSASTDFAFDEVIPVGYGITDEGGFYDSYENLDVAGKAVLIARYAPEEEQPHVDFDKYSSISDKIRIAEEHNAAAVFLYTPPEHDDTLLMLSAVRVSARDIPIIYLRRAGMERIGISIEDPQPFSASGRTELERIRDEGYNVVARLPGQTDTAIIFGAHYDHLGWGGPGTGSRYLGEEKMIHNGADDNGSGTSALIELARYYASRPGQNHHTMIFVAFSGEEFGLLGSSHYAKNMEREPGEVEMMINMDMIGRLKLDDTTKGLAIFGTGTAEEFTGYFDTLTAEHFLLTSKESGTGPSDHTAFYNRGIPVLHFFTGAHADYHKPEDDPDKINPEGIVMVTDIITGVVNHFDAFPGILTFQKTKAPENQMRSSFSVTLGIMPDYIAEVHGLRVDGVSPDRPGSRAGLKEGDIIIKMGEYEIEDIYGYMSALGKYRKGDSVTVIVERDGQPVNLDVVFE